MLVVLLLMHSPRFHYDAYDEWVTKRGLKAKAKAPAKWKKDESKEKKQVSIVGFTEKKVLAVKPKVTKAGILEYLIELLVDADLVSTNMFRISNNSIISNSRSVSSSAHPSAALFCTSIPN